MPLAVLTVSDLEGDESNVLGIPPLITPPIDLSPINQVIYLNDGWNMISSYIDTTQLTNWDFVNYPQTYTPPNDNLYKISEIFEQFLYRIGPGNFEYHVYSTNPYEFSQAVVIAKDNLGAAWLPEFDFDGMKGLMIGNIAGIFQGVQIKMNGSGYYLKLTGIPAALTNATSIDYPIRNGWNLIGFPYTQPISCEDFFEELLAGDYLIIAKDNLGNAFLPEWNFNGIGNLEPGQGYQIKVQNWINDATFSARVALGNTLSDGDLVVVNENEDVITIDDPVLVSDTNMTIDIPNYLIEPLLENFDIKKVLDEKINILRNFFNPYSELDSQKNITESLTNEIISQEITTNEEEKTLKQNEQEKATVFASTFDEELYFYINNYPIKGEPSGYSLQTQTYVNGKWAINRLKKNVFGISLYDELYANLYKGNIHISFIALTSNKNNLCGRLDIRILNGKYENAYGLAIKGDDTTTTDVVEGLTVNEIPQIFLFNSEKYNLCNFTLNNQTLNFADKKYINPTGLTLVQPALADPKL